jgi:hypothetical protein
MHTAAPLAVRRVPRMRLHAGTGASTEQLGLYLGYDAGAQTAPCIPWCSYTLNHACAHTYTHTHTADAHASSVQHVTSTRARSQRYTHLLLLWRPLRHPRHCTARHSRHAAPHHTLRRSRTTTHLALPQLKALQQLRARRVVNDGRIPSELANLIKAYRLHKRRPGGDNTGLGMSEARGGRCKGPGGPGARPRPRW